MGYWYWRRLKTTWAVNENTTDMFDLPEKGALSALFCRVYGTTAQSLDNVDNVQPVQYRTVKIVGNGNVDIFNLQSKHLYAINFWDTGVMPQDLFITLNGSVTGQDLVFPFGRYAGDMKYGLILDNWKTGIQFQDVNTISTTHYTDTTSKWDIWGLFRKNPEANIFSGGYIRKRQVYNRDTASATQWPLKLPTEAKLKQIHLFSEPDLSSGSEATDIFTNTQTIWLWIKSKEESLWENTHSGNLARFMHKFYKRTPFTVGLHGDGGETVRPDTMIYYRDNSELELFESAGGFVSEAASTWLSRNPAVLRYNKAGTQVGTYRFQILSKGICLCGDIPLLMIDPASDETEWLDAKTNGDIYLEVTEGASTGNWYPVLEELEKPPAV